MVALTTAPPVLDPRIISTYFIRDSLVGDLPVIIFHGPSTTTNSTRNSSRIQAHIYSIAGFQSFPRLTIAPTSPLYAAVHHLPDDKQGDEVYRGLAVSLLKYFLEMPGHVKICLTKLLALGCPDRNIPAIFDERHAASLASGMVRVENNADIIKHISVALAKKHMSWTDLDVVLPLGSIKKTIVSNQKDDSEENLTLADDGRPVVDYGKFNDIVSLFGPPSFLPTSKLRRAPSKPTAVGKDHTLAEHQKESLQREIKELVETEKSYVLKLQDLAKSAAVSHTRSTDSQSYTAMQPLEGQMRKLFPESLSQIHDMNTQFLNDITLTVGDNRQNSIDALQKNQGGVKIPERDAVGVEPFAKVLLRYFPRFRGPYQDYLRASAYFPVTLNQVLREGVSRYTEALHQIGEQRLKSLLIEPVQRLPRYSLFIDNIIKQLPAAHPATGKFLKAKDMITDICALDEDKVLDGNYKCTQLKRLVAKWPDSLAPFGRLINAVDAAELKAPYTTSASMEEVAQCILLLFPDYVLVLRKLGEHALSARGLLAEIDRPVATVSTASLTSIHPQSLSLTYAFRLEETRFTECHNGSQISLCCIRENSENINNSSDGDINYAIVTRTYYLLGSYEGKSSRWNEEVARARIEYRFPEKFREADNWGLRMINLEENGLGVVSAVFEDDALSGKALQRRLHGHIQLVIQHQQDHGGDKVWQVRASPVEITVRVVMLGANKYLLEFAGLGGIHSTEEIAIHDFWAVFIKRLSSLQRLHNQPSSPKTAQAYIAYAQKVVESIRPIFAAEESRPRSRFRPVSPVKALSGLLTSSLKDQTIAVKQLNTENPEVFSYSRLEAPTLDASLGKLDAQRFINTDPSKSKVSLISSIDQHPNGSLSHLEATLNTYIVALHSRNGNIVGKVLRGRSGADELRINELYNTLIEDSSQYQTAAGVSVDVLFSSFEKFLNREWKDRMGPIISSSLLERMQSLFSNPRTSHTVGHFKNLLVEMTPQNRRAFSAIIKLLSDLLDGSGNDGDRAALTIYFAEALVEDGNPHDFIPLFDYLVEDLDTFLDDAAIGSTEPDTPAMTLGTLQPTRSTNTGSLSSNGSSLRKRFGFGNLTRENSKTDSESKVGQMWRSLSKKASGDVDNQSTSISKSVLSRSRSTDNESRRPLLMVPDPQDQPSVSNFRQAEPRSRPGSAHNIVPDLIAIGESGLQSLQRNPKKKRRSSLSDLHSLQRISSPALEIKSQSRRLENQRTDLPPQSARKFVKDPSPLGMRSNSSSRPLSKLPSPTNRKENVRLIGPSTQYGKSGRPNFESPPISSLSQRKHGLDRSRIPSLRHGLQERRDASNSPIPVPKKLSSSPQKMRIQSPQKLRERLDKEQMAIQVAEPTLRNELAKIGEDLARLKISQKTTADPAKDFLSRINTVDARVSHTLSSLAKQNKSIQADIDSSLTVSEKKAKSLDELYREANAENELLYERFNTELMKVLKSVKSGEGVEEMRTKLKESQNETARLRKENQRLKRENLGLRSQLKEA